MEKCSSCSVDEDVERGIGNTTHDPLDERVGEANMGENQMEVGPAREIKGFGKGQS